MTHHNFMYTRRHFLKQSSLFSGLCLGLSVVPAFAADWSHTLRQARNQTVRFNAWGGDEKINQYIRWIGGIVKERFKINLEHVKLAETAEAVRTVLAEKTAGNNQRGTIDLLWINGENFLTMKQHDLLYGPFAEDLPAFQAVDVKGKPTVLNDFGTPTDGYESPWGMASFIMIANTNRVNPLPETPEDLLRFAQNNPGRFTYPAPPDYTGSAFLKQLLLSLNEVGEKESAHPDRQAFFQAVTPENYERLSAPLWAWLDTIHPLCWQDGTRFPSNYPMLRDLLGNQSVDFAMAYNPNEAASAILQDLLPAHVSPFTFKGGMIENTHFVAIPFNSPHSAGAQVVANTLLEPEAQAHKANLSVWGDPTVLDAKALSEDERALFKQHRHPAQLPLERTQLPLREPHPSWQEAIEATWSKRYTSK